MPPNESPSATAISLPARRHQNKPEQLMQQLVAARSSFPINRKERGLNSPVPRFVVRLALLSRQRRAKINATSFRTLDNPSPAVGGYHRACVLRNAPIAALKADADGTVERQDNNAQVGNRPTARQRPTVAYRLPVRIHQLNLQGDDCRIALRSGGRGL